MAWIISGIRPRAAAAVATLVAAVAVFAFPAPAGATAPWKAAEQVRSSLFEAQTALLLDAAGSSEAERAQKKLAAIRGRITAALRQARVRGGDRRHQARRRPPRAQLAPGA